MSSPLGLFSLGKLLSDFKINYGNYSSAEAAVIVMPAAEKMRVFAIGWIAKYTNRKKVRAKRSVAAAERADADDSDIEVVVLGFGASSTNTAYIGKYETVPSDVSILAKNTIEVTFQELVPVFVKTSSGEYAPKKSPIPRDIMSAILACRFDPNGSGISLENDDPLPPSEVAPPIETLILDLSQSPTSNSLRHTISDPGLDLSMTPPSDPKGRYPTRTRTPVDRNIFKSFALPRATKINEKVEKLDDPMEVVPPNPPLVTVTPKLPETPKKRLGDDTTPKHPSKKQKTDGDGIIIPTNVPSSLLPVPSIIPPPQITSLAPREQITAPIPLSLRPFTPILLS